MEVWRCGGVEVWRCGGVEVWRCGGVEVCKLLHSNNLNVVIIKSCVMCK